MEARRLADFNDVAHGRLALLLLDNAAETLLSRRAVEALIWADWHGNLLKTMEREGYSPNADSKADALFEELKANAVSDKTRQKIRQNFSDLVRFVFSLPDCELGPELAGCLNALHRYRNAAYHQDVVRNDVLGPANEIYFYLCCELLKHQKNMVMEIAPPPAIVVEVFGGQLPEQLSKLLVNDKTMGDAVAEELLIQNQLDHDSIASALAAHLTARIGVLETNLNEFVEYLGFTDRAPALRAIQLLPLSDAPLPPKAPDDYWTRPIPVTEKVIASWKRRAAAIARLSSGQDALRQFDEVERQMSAFEAQLEPFTIAIDREIQHEIDLRRGK
ncbi:hypothetical protein BN1232_05642 [Mycobacterium lentiflavum]|uniref:Uncharacterized protein n=1 Tax=Mycobacterium lentiflavum TaxID=141349 RepID=A0A0E4CQV9_MYCLN|nr:hypothetical protein [Mycobacterium lentiflavum]CQD22492.1 hypothetical protein BN1232_05642 [Mycobacterium lentiflavum]